MLSPLLLILAAAPVVQTWSGQTNDTPEVSISNIKGSIQVEGVEGKTVTVEARGQDGADAKNLLEVEQDGDGEVEITVCCGPCADSSKAARHCEDPPAVDVVVKVPRGAKLEVSGVSAPVKVSGVTGKQELTTVNGDVSVRGSRGALEVTAVNGNVELLPDVLAHTEVSTVAGNVKLKLPRGAGARVEYASVSGKFNGRGVTLGSSEQRYGNGEKKVEVSTVSGALDIQSDEAAK